MARASSRHAVGGGQSVQSVKIRPEWLSAIDEAKAARHFNARTWTPEEEAFLLQARAAGVMWRVISEKIGCVQDTARKRWRELSGKAKK